MRPTTPCPHPTHLRLFLDKKAQTQDAEWVREHLEQCEPCRARIAGFVAEPSVESTFADHDMDRFRQLVRPRSAEGSVTNTVADPGLAPDVTPWDPERTRKSVG